MFILSNYGTAVLFCFITMLCWGSWANTQKLSKQSAPFQIFYWDYALGVFALMCLAAFTLGSHGELGRPFLVDLAQASPTYIGLALFAGVIFNLANLLLVAVIDLAGMAVAFPITVGIALVLGVVVNYIAAPIGNAFLLAIGVFLIVAAILISAALYRKMQQHKAHNSKEKSPSQTKVLVISITSGVLMGSFYRFIIASLGTPHGLSFEHPEPTFLTPYTAMLFFSVGLLLSNFIFNTWMMKHPFTGSPIPAKTYWKQSLGFHGTGVLGGMIWGIGGLLNILASSKAGFAISYGLGQGATMIAALWGVFIWKEFAHAPAGTSKRLTLMFLCYIAGLITIIVARVV